ncbi:hypothetical protein BpHYR1_031016 [Brachionus plicatilis]|uniref:Uncharacterized protein n=1 Tax=Brachionus plicatilis TaxID=10195 RepID=A0A3M7PW06_BRAPC|nr:hypothetical protein BpHYR1_031016 [Brachionus plicatilis]
MKDFLRFSSKISVLRKLELLKKCENKRISIWLFRLLSLLANLMCSTFGPTLSDTLKISFIISTKKEIAHNKPLLQWLIKSKKEQPCTYCSNK